MSPSREELISDLNRSEERLEKLRRTLARIERDIDHLRGRQDILQEEYELITRRLFAPVEDFTTERERRQFLKSRRETARQQRRAIRKLRRLAFVQIPNLMVVRGDILVRIAHQEYVKKNIELRLK